MTLEEQLAAAADGERPLAFGADDLAARVRRRRRIRRLATGSFAIAVLLAAAGGAIALSQAQEPAGPVASTTTVTQDEAAAILVADRWVPAETDPSPIGAVLPTLAFEADGTLTARGAPSETGCSLSGTWHLEGETIVLDSTSVQEEGPPEPSADCSRASGTSKGALLDLIGDGPVTLLREDPPLIVAGGTRRNEATVPPGAVQLSGAFLQRFGEIGVVGRAESTPGDYRTPDGTRIALDADGTVVVGTCAPGLWDITDGTFTVTPGDEGRGEGSDNGCTGEPADIVRILRAGGPIRTTDDGRLWLDSDEGTLRLDPDQQPNGSEGAGDESVPASGEANALERLFMETFAALGVEPCCGQPSHGSRDAETGFVYDDRRIAVYATPDGDDVGLDGDGPGAPSSPVALGNGEALLVEEPRGDFLAMRCEPEANIFLSYLPGEVPGRQTLIEAASALAAAIDCRPTADPYRAVT